MSSVEYDWKKIEEKWIEEWEKTGEFKFEDSIEKPKFYILDMFPYPSGSGLHVGHLKGYLATDILARFYRMKGYSVFHPMGWDAFGLPAEQYAIQTGNSPKLFTHKNINNFRKQLKRLGLSYDFGLEIDTSDPNYFKHTQWIFSQLYKHGLAELRDTQVNWCEELNTVLSEEEIVEGADGKRYSERGNFEVVYKNMKQWVLKITEYADELVEGLEILDWPENVKKIQIDWIGKKEVYKFFFKFREEKYFIELKYASSIRKLKGLAVHKFSSIARELDINEITTGNREMLDIMLFDEFNLKPINVCYLWNADLKAPDLIPLFDGGSEEDFYDPEVEEYYVRKYKFKKSTTYKLRDWVFSRQRYWGEPIPMLYDSEGNVILDEELPVLLPEKVDYETKREAKSPLANDLEWLSVTKQKIKYKRESNTMPNWAGSCWYFMAYLLKKPDGTYYDLDSAEAKEILDRWLPVNIYVGGQEHATLHLMYARFWHKFLHKIGIVSAKEPFQSLVNQGLILGEDGSKMSKSKGNYVSIEEMIEKYGSDSLRTYEAFSGPTSLSFKWDEAGIKGIRKWLNKVFSFFKNLEKLKVVQDDRDINILENNLINNFALNVTSFKVNLGVSELMIFLNSLQRLNRYSHKSLSTFTQLLSMYAPALASELWHSYLKNSGTPFKAIWPCLNEIEKVNDFEYKVFVNGKFKFIINVSKFEIDKEDFLKTLVYTSIKENSKNKRIPPLESISFNHEKRIILVSLL